MHLVSDSMPPFVPPTTTGLAAMGVLQQVPTPFYVSQSNDSIHHIYIVTKHKHSARFHAFGRASDYYWSGRYGRAPTGANALLCLTIERLYTSHLHSNKT